MTRSEKWFTILAVLFATCAVYDIALIIIEASKPAVPDDALFWFQMYSGSSWPEWRPYQKQEFFLAGGIAVQVMLAITPVLSVLWIGYKLISERRDAMSIAMFLEEHDLALRTRFLSLVSHKISPSDAAKIEVDVDKLMADEHEKWKRKVIAKLGEDRAHEIFRQIEQEA